MFKGLSFTVFEYGTDLGPKRSIIIQNIIKKNKGTIISKLSCIAIFLIN